MKAVLCSPQMSNASQLRFLKRMSLYLPLLLLTCFAKNQNQVQYVVTNRETIETRLKDYAGKDSQREATLERFSEESGCNKDKLSQQPVKHLKEPNLICTLPGQTDSVILVGAHFDHVTAGDGVADNWSGASLLPSLFYSLRNQPHHCTFLFVEFAGEEQGLVGSQYYTKQWSPEQRARIKAMINLDTLGLTPTKVWVSHADRELLVLLERVAHRLDLPLAGVNVDGVGTADSESFAKFNIPRITIHSVTQETMPILHSKRDRLDAINMDTYYSSYRLLAAYLAVLDSQLGQSTVPAPAH